MLEKWKNIALINKYRDQCFTKLPKVW